MARASTTTSMAQKLTDSYMLVKLYVWCHRTTVRAARRRNGAHECLHDFRRRISPEQAHGVLHDRGITGKCDSPVFAAYEAELLLRHPQELAEDRRAEVRQRHLEPCPVGGVHHAVALRRHHRRCRAALIVGCSFGRCRGLGVVVMLYLVLCV